MKSTTLLVCFAAIVCLFAANPARAESPFYLRAALGPAMVDDVDMKNRLVGDGRMSVKYAGSLGLAGGWQINRWIGVELESGAFYTDFDWLYDSFGEAVSSAQSDLLNIPLTANLVLRYESPKHRWSGYVRGGIGGTTSRYSATAMSEGPRAAEGTEWDIALAYRVGAGVGYRISQNWSVELGYEFFGSGETDYDLVNGQRSRPDPLYVELGSVRAQFVHLAFRFDF